MSGLPFLFDPGTKPVSCVSCIGKWILYQDATWEAHSGTVFSWLNISFLTIFPYKAIWNHIENINYKILFISVPYLYSSSFEQLNLFNWWFLFILKYKSRKKEMSFSSEKHAGNFGGRIVDSVLAHFLNQGQILGLLWPTPTHPPPPAPIFLLA